jgi:hypothetical protein
MGNTGENVALSNNANAGLCYQKKYLKWILDGVVNEDEILLLSPISQSIHVRNLFSLTAGLKSIRFILVNIRD